MQWFYVKDGKKEGPLTNADIPQFVQRGEITDSTLVWNSTMEDWTPYGEVTTKAPTDAEISVPALQGGICSLCRKTFDADQLIEFEGALVCGGCKPLFLQQLKENAAISGGGLLHYAGFWTRFGAKFIDGLIVSVVTIPCNVFIQLGAAKVMDNLAMIPVMLFLYVIMLVVPAGYSIWMHGKCGSTVGKKAMGIKVIRSDGSPITYGRATGRHFSEFLSAIMYIGYIIAGFDDEKRGLHDHICDTRVVYK